MNKKKHTKLIREVNLGQVEVRKLELEVIEKE